MPQSTACDEEWMCVGKVRPNGQSYRTLPARTLTAPGSPVDTGAGREPKSPPRCHGAVPLDPELKVRTGDRVEQFLGVFLLRIVEDLVDR
jgi:hypothetical protein